MNIIILAAGKGTRLDGTIYEGTPKSLIKLKNGKSSIEMLLDYYDNLDLVDNIYIVTGYKHEMFYQLAYTYSKVIEITNAHYDKPSNKYSLEEALSNFPTEDSLIIDADTVVTSSLSLEFINFIDHEYNYVFTCDKRNSENEWVVKSDNKTQIITSVRDNTEGLINHITSGLVFINKETLEDVYKYISTHDDLKYWDDYYKNCYYKFKEWNIPGFNRFLEIDNLSDINYVNGLLCSKE